MLYQSTRGGSKGVCFEEAVLQGLCPDGGLYVPEEIPSLGSLEGLEKLTFQELALHIFSLFIPAEEIPRDELVGLISASYATFADPKVVAPVVEVAGCPERVLELWHGPTLAFKDVALQFLGNLFAYFLERKNRAVPEGGERKRITVVGATSGDTGSAAIYGLRSKPDVSVFILHPRGRVSPVQAMQMTTVTDANVHNISIEGNFDDCQGIVKSLFADRAWAEARGLAAVNSINWARILAQTTYYVHAYLHAGLAPGQGARFVVPTGNFGDVLAGYYAREMGLPITLVVATNENDIMDRFIRTGRYSPREIHASHSPAMDISVSSNFERFAWHVARTTVGGDAERASALIAGWWGDLKSQGAFEVAEGVRAAAAKILGSGRASDSETLQTIREVYDASEAAGSAYILDPHTAVGVAVARKEPSAAGDAQDICLATANPAKFEEAVDEALAGAKGWGGMRELRPEGIRALEGLPRRCIDLGRVSWEEVREVVDTTLKSDGVL
jgi:threonine synthase